MESEKSNKQKKRPDLSELLVRGEFVDVYSTLSRCWRLGLIVDVQDGEIEVVFEYTGKRSSELFKIGSPKLTYARRQTGWQQYLDENSSMKMNKDYCPFNEEQCQARISELNQIIANQFQGMTAHAITQTVRCRQLLFLEMVLTLEENPEAFPHVLKYILTWLDFIKFYFQLIKEYSADFTRQGANPDLFLSDERAAVAACFPEVNEALFMIGGGIWRLLKPMNCTFLLNFDSYLEHTNQMKISESFTPIIDILDFYFEQQQPELEKTIRKTQSIILSCSSCLVIYWRIMSYFDQIDGFKVYFELVRYLNLKSMLQYFYTLTYLLKFWDKPIQRNICKQLLQSLQYRVDNLNESEVKELELEAMREIIKQNNALERHISQQERLVTLEEITKSAALKYLNSPFLEKKVKALTEIKDLTERVENSIFTKEKDKAIATKEQLSDWLLKNEVLERVLIGDNLHFELIKRAGDLAGFLCRDNRFPLDMIDRIWISSQNKHESINSAIYEFFQSLTLNLSKEGLDRLYHFISQIKEYNELSVNLISKICEQAFIKLGVGDPSTQYYGLEQLWELMKDERQPHSELAYHRVKSLLQMVHNPEEMSNVFLCKCMELIKEHKCIYQATTIIKATIEKQFIHDSEGRHKLIRSIDSKYKIVELFVRDIEHYLAIAREYFQNEPVQNKIIPGTSHNFQLGIMLRIQILCYLIGSSDLELSWDQIIRLWDECCVKTKGNIQKEELIRGIVLDQSRKSRFFGNRKTQDRFFYEILCNNKACDYESFSMEELNLWRDLSSSIISYQINSENGIRPQNGLYLTFSGIDSLWGIIEAVKDQIIFERACMILVAAHSEYSPENIRAAYQMMIDRAVGMRCNNRCVTLLSFIIRYFEGDYTSADHNKRKDTPYQIIWENNLQQFAAPAQTTIGALKKRLSETISKSFKQIYLRVGDVYPEDSTSAEQETPYEIILDTFNPREYLAWKYESFLMKIENDPQNAIKVWNFLSTIPDHRMVYQHLDSITIDWDEMFKSNFYRIAYYLKYVATQSINPLWQQRFSENNLDHLIRYFMSQRFTFRERRNVEVQCVSIFFNLLKIYQAKNRIDPNTLEEYCHHLVEKLMEQPEVVFDYESDLLKQICAFLNDASIFVGESAICAFLVGSPNATVRQTYQQILQELKKTNKVDSSKVFNVLLNSIFIEILRLNTQECQQFFETFLDYLTTHSSQVPQELINNMIAQLDYVDGYVRAGTFETLKLLSLTPTQVKRIMDKIYQQILRDEIQTSQFKCMYLCLSKNVGVDHFLNLFTPLIKCPVWRTRSQFSWAIRNNLNEKSNTGYAGLYNLACICYMNSLLQQLYMIPSFREQLLQTEDPSNQEQDENLLYQLQCLMLALKLTEKQYHNPRKFCTAFKDLEGLPVNVYEQMDVDEFFNLLMERLEDQMKSDLIKKTFRGAIANQVIGTCEHVSEREEAFIALSLTVKDKRSVMQSLQSVIKGDVLEGDNAYFCEKCGKKVNAVKRMSIKTLPPQLILVLKRFEYDFDLRAKVKINDYCEFPQVLDMMPYTQRGQEGSTDRELYNLKGVVIHQGNADSGHYYSYIKDKEQWIQFNDTLVSFAKLDDVINEGYGGSYSDKKKYIEKTKNAYLLFYEKKSIIQEELPSQPEISPKLNEFKQDLMQENEKFHIQKAVFNQEFFNFISLLLRSEHLQSELLIFISQFIFCCAIREAQKQWFMNNITAYKYQLSRNPSVCKTLSHALGQGNYLREFLQECPHHQTRRYVVSIIVTVVKVSQEYDYNSCFMFMHEAKSKNWVEYLDLLRRLVQIQPHECAKRRLLSRLLSFFSFTLTKAQKLKIQIEDLPVPQSESFLFGQQELICKDYDEALEKRFEKQHKFNQSLQYLWMAVADLLRFKPSDQEFRLIYNDLDFLSNMISECDTKQSVKAVCSIVCRIITENEKPQLNTHLIKLIKDKHIHQPNHKQYFRAAALYRHIMAIDDKFQRQRIEEVMREFIEIMIKQLNYPQETDVCQQYLLRICALNPKVLQWMVNHQDIWAQKFFKDFDTQKIQDDNFWEKNGNGGSKNRLYGIFHPTNKQSFLKVLQWRRHYYTQIWKEQTLTLEPFDGEQQLNEVKLNDWIDYYNVNTLKWQQVQVVNINDEYLSLSCENQQILQERDSEYLAPFKTFSELNLLQVQEIESDEANNANQSESEDNATQGGNRGSEACDSDDQ